MTFPEASGSPLVSSCCLRPPVLRRRWCLHDDEPVLVSEERACPACGDPCGTVRLWEDA